MVKYEDEQGVRDLKYHGIDECLTPLGASRRHRMAIAAAALCVAFAATCGAGETTRATGYRPPPRRTNVLRANGAAKGSRMKFAATPLPSSWDSRDHGWVTPVKNQLPWGTCWAFAANAVIETQLLRTGCGEWDLSEKNMVMLCGFKGDWNSGGDYDNSTAYLLRWGGTVLEANDQYRTNRNAWESIYPSVPLDPAHHIQHVVLVPALDGTVETRNALKSAIMDYGAVATCAYWNGEYEKGDAYYYNGPTGCNHAIAVVGWDDEYPTNNFKNPPSEKGAWLIKNSWGTSSGNKGYWHVSYYDTKFGTYDGAVFIPATPEENYTAVYGYDKYGVLYDFVQEHVEKSPYWDPFDLMAAVFTSGWNEELAAVGVYTLTNPCPYEISIYTNVTRNAETPTEGGILVRQMTGTLSHAGFTTIHLPAPIPLADHTTFSVVFRQTGNGRSNPLCCTCVDYCYPHLDLGQSYFGYSGTNGEEDVWIDGADKDIIDQVDSTDEAWAACIKAYTRTTVAARAGDAPGGRSNGTKVLEALAATNALAYAQHGEAFGAFANIVGANGRTLWTNWLAGLDPADPEDDFRVPIAVTNGTPSLSWTPDLGAERTYTILGCADLSAPNGWEPVDKSELPTTTNRFFKVTVGN